MKVFHRNTFVGNFIDPESDMWYLDGKFEPTGNDESQLFIQLVQKLDAKACTEDPGKAIRVTLKESDNGDCILFIIMSFQDGKIFGRQIVDPEARQWAIDNIPE